MSELIRSDYFPTSVWYRQLENSGDLNFGIVGALNDRRRTDPEGDAISNKNGWQSSKKLHEEEEFSVIAGIVEQAVAEIARFLKAKDTVRPRVTHCWGNVNELGSYNVAHTHPNSFLSAVYYVTVPPESGDIVFYDPRVQMDGMRLPVTEVSAFTAPEVGYQPKPGMLLLFPSWLQHRVEISRSEIPRVTLAFNTSMFD